MEPSGLTITSLERRIRVARGEERADLVITGGQVVSVFSGEVTRTDAALADGSVAGIGSYTGRQTFDAAGGHIAPGLGDAHIHLESSCLTPRELGVRRAQRLPASGHLRSAGRCIRYQACWCCTISSCAQW